MLRLIPLFGAERENGGPKIWSLRFTNTQPGPFSSCHRKAHPIVNPPIDHYSEALYMIRTPRIEFKMARMPIQYSAM